MNELKAVVIAVEAKHLLVEAATQGCGRCHEPGGCGGVSLGTMLCAAPRRLRVPYAVGGFPVQVGDSVDLGIAAGVLRRGAVAAYALPLLGVMMGALLGSLCGEAWAVAGSLVGLALAWVGATPYRMRAEKQAGELRVVRHYPFSPLGKRTS